jgi:hypothetical protein
MMVDLKTLFSETSSMYTLGIFEITYPNYWGLFVARSSQLAALPGAAIIYFIPYDNRELQL